MLTNFCAFPQILNDAEFKISINFQKYEFIKNYNQKIVRNGLIH